MCECTTKAGGRIRTPDRLITNQLLYQLSYASVTLFIKAYLVGLCLAISSRILPSA
jgi:hypothetical protein